MSMPRRWITRFDQPIDNTTADLAHALNLATSQPLNETTGQPRTTLCGIPIPHGQTSWYYTTPEALALRDLCGPCSYLAGRPDIHDIREAG